MAFNHSAFQFPAPGGSVDRVEITAGDQAPDFSLVEADGGKVQLSQYRGQAVVAIFFRRDW